MKLIGLCSCFLNFITMLGTFIDFRIKGEILALSFLNRYWDICRDPAAFGSDSALDSVFHYKSNQGTWTLASLPLHCLLPPFRIIHCCPVWLLNIYFSKYINANYVLGKQYEILKMNGCFLWQKTLLKCGWLKWHECYFPQNEVASFFSAYILVYRVCSWVILGP